jgi:hypothetical protein
MLFKLKELSDLYADACVRDESGQLMFLSLYGRDTAIQQLLAAFTLKVTEGGLSAFHLQDPDGQAHVVYVGNAERLEKFTGKLPRDNLFGNLAHVWLYDLALIRPDRSNRVAWVLVDSVQHASNALEVIWDRAWDLYKLLSPVPLLDTWQHAVLSRTGGDVVTLLRETAYPPLGRIDAARISLPESFPETVSGMVKVGELTLVNQALENLALAA